MEYFAVCLLVFLVLQGFAKAQSDTVTCTTPADCAWGETCVAGDSETSVQACVPPTICGGASMGNCPSDSSGELACLWRPIDDCTGGCAILNGNRGLYKCVSILRCDAYYGGSFCSDSCSVNGVRCNGHGSCNMMATNDAGMPVFGCTCDVGYSGEKCDTITSSFTFSNNTPSNGNTGSLSGGQDNEFSVGFLHFGSDDSQSDNSLSGGSDSSSLDALKRSNADSNTTHNSSLLRSDQSDQNASDKSSLGKAKGDDPSNSTAASSSSTEETTDSASTSSQNGLQSGVVVLIVLLSTFFLVGTVIMLVQLRRKKRKVEEEYANALAFTHENDGSRDPAFGLTTLSSISL
ncbi:hypothetical protein CCR75_003067 [Bremia lactucae]|uniref:EGF-like domain-containing protein n=1 Tax=Bremia lactucae TaxID=4779 RepID=A0A976IMA2_BRELC|nr:hypothetical protein CCR75_003067 [Bremia lactucae]